MSKKQREHTHITTAPAPAASPEFAPARRTPWVAADYAPLIRFSGAHKLAASGVAPLVAVARGYETVEESQSKDLAERSGIGDRRSAEGRQFQALFRDGGEVMVMPWFNAETVIQSQEGLIQARQTSLQIRPSAPRVDQHTGKARKYEFLIKHETVLDFHPATPRSWISHAPRLLIAEGLLKGDAALTAQLLANGITVDELSVDAGGDNPRGHLMGLMNRIPESERVAIISIAGVTTWSNRNEWVSLNLREKEALISFDGDVATNYNVWREARKLFEFLESKHATPYLVDLSDLNDEYRFATGEKGIGLDDFLAGYGDWDDVLSSIVDVLPDPPERGDDALVGQWRVGKNGYGVEECVAIRDQQGVQVGTTWEHRNDIGGRVVSTDVRRIPTSNEASTGVFDDGQADVSDNSRFTVELTWRDELSDTVRSAQVNGPATMMHYPPSEWVKQGAQIPNSVLLHPDWPPRKNPAEWLSAIKSNHPEDAERRTNWACMGYVPVEDGLGQAFIVGDQVIAPTTEAATRTSIGITERDLPGASDFGVDDAYRSDGLSSEADRAGIRADLEALKQALFDDTPWQDDAVAPVIAALALRPVVPIRPMTVAYLSGSAGKGKSWTAQIMMSFWAKQAGVWGNKLPGSAKDTFTSTESAIAKTPIWVIDDWAPSTDRRQSEREGSSIADLVREVFNGAPKRRSNIDQSARDTPHPRALLVITAENEHAVSSIRDRVVPIEFLGLNNLPTDGVRPGRDRVAAAGEFAHHDTAASRITAAAIRLHLHWAEQKGWEHVVATANGYVNRYKDIAKDIVKAEGLEPGAFQRPIQIAADVMIGLRVLRDLAEHVGMDEFASELGRVDGHMGQVARFIISAHSRKEESNPGRLLLSAVADLLSSGRAHIVGFSDPTLPPAVDGDNAVIVNQMLGWRPGNNGEYQPSGPAIGYYGITPSRSRQDDDPERVIFLNPAVAFGEAQRWFSSLIPHGSSERTTWRAVWGAKLIHPTYLRVRGERPEVATERFKLGSGPGAVSMRGIPVSLDTLFDSPSSHAAGVEPTADAEIEADTPKKRKRKPKKDGDWSITPP